MGGMLVMEHWKPDEFRNAMATNETIFQLLKESALDEVDSMSIGKLRAICEKDGIRAGKMRRAELTRHVRRIIGNTEREE